MEFDNGSCKLSRLDKLLSILYAIALVNREKFRLLELYKKSCQQLFARKILLEIYFRKFLQKPVPAFGAP